MGEHYLDRRKQDRPANAIRHDVILPGVHGQSTNSVRKGDDRTTSSNTKTGGSFIEGRGGGRGGGRGVWREKSVHWSGSSLALWSLFRYFTIFYHLFLTLPFSLPPFSHSPPLPLSPPSSPSSLTFVFLYRFVPCAEAVRSVPVQSGPCGEHTERSSRKGFCSKM